jgi:hypothetical protein
MKYNKKKEFLMEKIHWNNREDNLSDEDLHFERACFLLSIIIAKPNKKDRILVTNQLESGGYIRRVKNIFKEHQTIDKSKLIIEQYPYTKILTGIFENKINNTEISIKDKNILFDHYQILINPQKYLKKNIFKWLLIVSILLLFLTISFTYILTSKKLFNFYYFPTITILILFSLIFVSIISVKIYSGKVKCTKLNYFYFINIDVCETALDDEIKYLELFKKSKYQNTESDNPKDSMISDLAKNESYMEIVSNVPEFCLYCRSLINHGFLRFEKNILTRQTNFPKSAYYQLLHDPDLKLSAKSHIINQAYAKLIGFKTTGELNKSGQSSENANKTWEVSIKPTIKQDISIFCKS